MSSEEKTPVISIVTPAYNRGKLLNRCYKSLVRQSSKKFEWIVVDDGSTDDTKTVMEKICAGNDSFYIRYVWKENGGKHTALNASHPYIRGKYVLILDSDDWLTDDAIAVVCEGWNKYKDDASVAMVTFAKRKSNGEICAYAKDEHVPTDILRYKRTRVSSSDCCEVLRTELFLKYPFPVYDGERFLAETALWYRVGLEGSCIYINKIIYICEYIKGGLTDSGRAMRMKNPQGGMYTSYLRMNRRCFFKERVKATLLYVCYGRAASYTALKIIKKAKPYRFEVLLGIIPGTVLFKKWNKEYL